MQSAKLSARRNLTRDWAGTAGSEREIGATAHPTLPSADNGRLGHVHVISSGSAGEQQKHADRRTTSRGGKAGRQAAGMADTGRSNAEAQPPAVSWGGGGGRERERDGGSFGHSASNRQAETTARSVRSEEGTLQKQGTRDGTQYVAVGSGELFLVYRGHVLILQRPNSLVSQAYRSGTHGNVPSTGESQSGWVVRRLS